VPPLRELQQGPDGSVYAIPYHDGPVMLLYRTDPYDDPAERQGYETRFGYPLAPAATWDEFADQAQWFTARPKAGTAPSWPACSTRHRRLANRMPIAPKAVSNPMCLQISDTLTAAACGDGLPNLDRACPCAS